ncbi:MAG: hypothetical protein Q4P72_03040 [Eubacteriales bacterium]|nr:hypothetical protein [Eubacteriales bacterium]
MLTILAILGLAASLLMGLGDQLLYYHPAGFDMSKSVDDIYRIMPTVSDRRLRIGSILGPLTALLFVIAQYHTVLLIRHDRLWLGYLIWILLSIGISVGGCFHAMFGLIGFIGREQQSESLDALRKFMDFFRKFFYPFIALGFSLWGLCILLVRTQLPPWGLLFTPLVILFFTPLLSRIPRGRFQALFCGSWTNLMQVPYYIFLLVFSLTH